jgi:hypothetical protein
VLAINQSPWTYDWLAAWHIILSIWEVVAVWATHNKPQPANVFSSFWRNSMKFQIAFLIFMLLASVAVPNQKQKQTTASNASDQKYQEALERYKRLLQVEINTVETQLKALRLQVVSGKIGPDGAEIISARKALMQLRQRMAAFDAGVIQIPAAPAVSVLTNQRNEETIPARETELKIRHAHEDFGKFLEEEIELVKLQINALDKKFQTGTLDINSPEMMSAKRELLELQQRMAVFDAGLLLSPTAVQPK